MYKRSAIDDATFTLLDDLESRCDRWLVRHRDYANPLDPDSPNWVLAQKALAEITLERFVSAASDRPGLAAYDEQIFSVVNDPAFYLAPLRHPDRFFSYAFPMLYAKNCGRLDSEPTEVLRRLVERNDMWAAERAASDALQLWFFCQLGGYDCQYDVEDVLRLSCLRHQPNVVTATRVDAYRLTHDLMFYHLLGLRPVRANRYDTEELLGGLLLRFVAEGNYDLVLELLVAGALTGELSKSVVSQTLSWVLRTTRGLDYVPGHASDDVADGHQSFDRWEESYHSTVVASLCAKVVRERWDELPATSKPHGRTRDLLAFGQALSDLSEYRLVDGARRIASVAPKLGLPAGAPKLSSDVASFLESQFLGEQYGIWTEERYLFEELGGDPDAFDELVGPVTLACESAIRAVRS